MNTWRLLAQVRPGQRAIASRRGACRTSSLSIKAFIAPSSCADCVARTTAIARRLSSLSALYRSGSNVARAAVPGDNTCSHTRLLPSKASQRPSACPTALTLASYSVTSASPVYTFQPSPAHCTCKQPCKGIHTADTPPFQSSVQPPPPPYTTLRHGPSSTARDNVQARLRWKVWLRLGSDI